MVNNMDKLFIEIINLSISSSYLILFVILIRSFFVKIPKKYICILWILVGIRLILPITVETKLSMIPSAQTIDPVITETLEPSFNSGIDPIDSIIVPIIQETVEENENIVIDFTHICINIWIIGIIMLLTYSVYSSIRLSRLVHDAVLLRDNIWQSEKVESPFIMGLLSPKIYIPYHLDNEAIEYIELHEDCHLCRKDHWIKAIGFIILTIHWFNPFVWFSYYLLGQDIENACDELVLEDLDSIQRKNYANTLLECTAQRRFLLSPLAFKEESVKERIIRIINYKKPTKILIVLALILCGFTIVCFMTNPKVKYLNENQAYKKYKQLDEVINNTIMDYYDAGDYNDEYHYACETHHILALEEKSVDTIVVYAMINFGKYELRDSIYCVEQTQITPTAITYNIKNNQYLLKEYWVPENKVLSDILVKEKFPNEIDYNSNTFSKQLNLESLKKANEYFETDIKTILYQINEYPRATQDALLTTMIDVYVFRPTATDDELMKKSLGINENKNISIDDFRLIYAGWNDKSFHKVGESVSHGRGMIYIINSETHHWKQEFQIVPYNPWFKKLSKIMGRKVLALNNDQFDENQNIVFSFKEGRISSEKFNPVYTDSVYFFKGASEKEIVEYVKSLPLSIDLGEYSKHQSGGYCEHSMKIGDVNLYVEREDGKFDKY